MEKIENSYTLNSRKKMWMLLSVYGICGLFLYFFVLRIFQKDADLLTMIIYLIFVYVSCICFFFSNHPQGWYIDDTGISYQHFTNIKQRFLYVNELLLRGTTHQKLHYIRYEDITSIHFKMEKTGVAVNKHFYPDALYMHVKTKKDMLILYFEINDTFVPILKMLHDHHIKMYDKEGIIEMILAKKNIYQERYGEESHRG